jgi:hypothetical protein
MNDMLANADARSLDALKGVLRQVAALANCEHKQRAPGGTWCAFCGGYAAGAAPPVLPSVGVARLTHALRRFQAEGVSALEELVRAATVEPSPTSTGDASAQEAAEYNAGKYGWCDCATPAAEDHRSMFCGVCDRVIRRSAGAR